jgi:hypothetical protein
LAVNDIKIRLHVEREEGISLPDWATLLRRQLTVKIKAIVGRINGLWEFGVGLGLRPRGVVEGLSVGVGGGWKGLGTFVAFEEGWPGVFRGHGCWCMVSMKWCL